MKRQRKQSGLILMYVILLLTLVGPATWMLSNTALQSARKTRIERVEAQADNLLLSAQAWADQNRQTLLEAPAGTVFEPGLAGLQMTQAACRITVLEEENGQARIQIETQSAIGRVARSEKRVIGLQQPESENS